MPAHLELVLVDLHHLVGVEHVVEGHQHDAGLVGALDHRVEAVGLTAMVTIASKPELMKFSIAPICAGDVGAGRDDLEFLDLRP